MGEDRVDDLLVAMHDAEHAGRQPRLHEQFGNEIGRARIASPTASG